MLNLILFWFVFKKFVFWESLRHTSWEEIMILVVAFENKIEHILDQLELLLL